MSQKRKSPVIKKILSSSRSPDDDRVIYVNVESDEGPYNLILPAETARSLLKQLESETQTRK